MPRLRGIGTLLFIVGLLLSAGTTVSAQSLSLSYTPSFGDTTIISFLEDIERTTDVSLSYSTSQFNAYQRVALDDQTLTIEEALRILFSAYEVALIERSNKKVIISVKDYIIDTKYFTTNGYIMDSESGERLYGASIYHLGKDRGTHCNEEGFFSISNIQKGDVIRVSYIGYRDEFISVDTSSLRVHLSADLEVSPIVITQEKSTNPNTGGEVIDLNSASAKVNILGERDLIHMARQKAGVYSGSEGLGGLIVRGGSPDQNLMILEDIPMYSTNHMADISSIFMEEATRDAQLIKGGFPSRYSGRLSSVLEVNLKDGNQERLKGSVSAGLPGFKAFLEGPLSDKSTFLIGGRLSWVNAYIDPLIDKFTVFDDVNLSFHDFVAKYTYRFNNTSTFTISGYKGGDKVNLEKNQTIIQNNGASFNSEEETGFGWGNELLSAKYSAVVSSKLFVNANVGLLHFDYRSKASYHFVNTKDNQVTRDDNRNVITDSGIVNVIGGLNFDYFINSTHKIKFGLGYNHHRFSPKIEQNITDVETSEPSIDPDSITIGNEVSLFIEDTFTPNKKVQIYGGFNFTHFGVRGANFNHLQPRIKVSIQPQNDISLSFTGSRMVQFVHLLVNNGLGLPSDLWVPSTDEIAPEISDQFGMSIRMDLGYDHVFTLGGYIKKQQNVILYRDPQDLYSNILNDANSKLNFISDRDWERKIEIGNRNIEGLELSLQKATGIWQYNFSYTKSNAANRFENLNQSKAFADRYDRPHDVNLSLSYRVTSKWNIGAQWVYGSGFVFTLKLINIKTPDGPTVLTTDELNNYRMPAYHHLDLLAKYDNTTNGRGWKVSFGFYNVYNRYNPYFLYGFEISENVEPVFIQLSLFPFYPHFNTTYSF